jgi:DNA repair exonuclease SbcCD ATPase subunit
MDEVLELSLDDIGKDEILNCLRKKSGDFDTLFVISHSKGVQDKFDNIINVKLEEGVSKIE